MKSTLSLRNMKTTAPQKGQLISGFATYAPAVTLRHVSQDMIQYLFKSVWSPKLPD